MRASVSGADSSTAARCRHVPSPGGYRRHRPEQTVLYQCVEQHWDAFVERAEQAGGLPRFVTREFEAYLKCGRLEYGCLRLGCRACGYEQLVAWSCKKRGFCPSCLGRRMTLAAVHLEQNVLPEVPLRQWVCTLPWRLRYLCGYDKALCRDVLNAFIAEVMRSLRHRAKKAWGWQSVSQAHPGSVTFIQRFDSALRLNVHFHTLALDGVYVRNEHGELEFLETGEPTAAEVADVARRTAKRVANVLERHGRSARAILGYDASDDDYDDYDNGAGDDTDPLQEQQLALASCYGAAARGTTLFGTRAGQPTLRLVQPSDARATAPAAAIMGFDVHAKVAIDGRDRKRVERICRYLGRPPIATDRLEWLDDGRLRYTMKKAWSDGTHALVFEPLDLIARLCAMIPPPRFHMVRYHGVLSSHASRRPEVVPEPPPPDSGVVPQLPQQLELFCIQANGDHSDDVPQHRPSRKRWSWLLKHVFSADLQRCPNCSGPLRWLEVATTKDAIARLLERHGEADAIIAAPKTRAPRAPPPAQLRLDFHPSA